MKQLSLFIKRLFFTILVLAITANILPAQVAINDDGTTPDNSAMLDVKSADKGLLIPRLTTTARTTLTTIAVAGLMVYDTDLNKFFYFDGTIWQEGSVGGSLWEKSGSNTYLKNLSDDVGIGTSSPTFDIDVIRSTGNAFLRLKSADSYAGILIDKAEEADNGYIIWNTGGAEHWYVGLIKNNDFAVSQSFASADGTFYIEQNGDIGMGTAVPGANLEILGADETELRITRPADNWAGVFSFYTGADREWGMTLGSGSDNLVLRRGTGNTTGNLHFAFNGAWVGLGTSTPASKIHLHDAASDSLVVFLTPQTTSSEDKSSILFGEDHDGTFGMLWTYNGVSNDMEIWGKSNTTMYGPHVLIDRNSGSMAIGETFATGYKLSVDGKIICEELRVDLSAGWPDYVFGKDYKLKTLQELDSFIQENGHLPNIPAAEEIQESGLEVGEMQRLMMEKIEELTLYILQQQKEIDELKAQITKNQE